MEFFLLSVGTLVPILLFLVVIHELGHFATARSLGVKVLEFGVGFPPRAFGFYTGNTRVLIAPNTRFINLSGETDLQPGSLVKVTSDEDAEGNLVARIIELPQKGVGWAARIGLKGGANEQPDAGEPEVVVDSDQLLKHEGKVRSVENGSMVLADMLYSVNWAPLGGFVRLAGESNPAIPRSLASKGVGTRFLVLVAGPLMNALLPIAIFTVLLMMPQDVLVGQVAVDAVTEGSPAQAAGIQQDDIILSSDGAKMENAGDLIRYINLKGGSSMEWLVARGSHQEIIRVTPAFVTEEGRWLVGIGTRLDNSRIEKRSQAPWTAFRNSFVNTWEMLVLMKQGIFGAFSSGSSPQFSGPIGIAQITGEFAKEGGLVGVMGITILLSINLAILNILPIPALDGGRLVFVVLEWVRRGKRVPPDKEGMVHLIGFVVLIGFIILVSANDISRLIQCQRFLG
ncbi:Membrane-associated zinc metalloprotease [hydrothermal vent metagenome]|uniref:Membrane-associated zinc metalloprotease n=1 Tax=hydrothermal vent metagenome TaxID=652676 RepID=A0A160V941_9ZZZZ